MCGFYCIAFIKDVIAWETVLDYTNSVSTNDYKKWQNNINFILKINMAEKAIFKFRFKK